MYKENEGKGKSRKMSPPVHLATNLGCCSFNVCLLK